MKRVDLAKSLIAASSASERKKLIADNAHIADIKLADEIRNICYSTWTVEPKTAQKAALAMRTLAKSNEAQMIKAASFWVEGISSITKGKFALAVDTLTAAILILNNIGLPKDAAQAQVAQLLALAMLGQYDEAIETGTKALAIFQKSRDHLDAGKIEMNLSNIVSRQKKHSEAEKYGRSALAHFTKAKEKRWIAMAENGLAITYAELNNFKKAAQFYEKALKTARSEKMLVTEAEIEAGLGNLALLRGSYSEALKFLESSRQKYDQLGMPHQSAIADLEIADIYSELNMFTEACDTYARIAPIFMNLRMRGEEARTRLNYARSLKRLNKPRLVKLELTRALRLFKLEENRAGQASTLLARAEIEISQGLFPQTLADVASMVEISENPRHIIMLQLLKAKAFEGIGDLTSALQRYTEAARFARKHRQINALQSALTGLGRISALQGERANARSFYTRSIKVVEGLRSTISTDEFSRSFLASRLDPFDGLAELFLSERRFADAFRTIERGRSRSLLDSMDVRTIRSGVPKHLAEKEREMRAELDFYYKKLATSADDEIAAARSDIRRSESELANISRQIDSLASPESKRFEAFELKDLQTRLSGLQTLIEFVERNGVLSAFVVTSRSVKFVTGLGTTREINEKLESLHFHFASLRYGNVVLPRFGDQLKKRVNKVLQLLYDQLLRPLEKHLDGDGLIIVPVGSLNYVPFHALHNGNQYVLQRFEVGYSPSAAIWLKLIKEKAKPPQTALLMAFADEKIPRAESEIREIGKIFPEARRFVGDQATVEAFYQNVAKKDIVHLACHGQFRPDNPMFSSLNLSDGLITVRDILAKRLDAGLVTLSACETGRNKIFAGEEILGLARGFLSAGASSIIVSLWKVDDSATSKLMTSLYSHLIAGETPGRALRMAQIEMIETGFHPYFWSPFSKIGG